MIYHAYCWQSGLLEFASRKKDIPAGVLLLGMGGKKWRDTVLTCSRHSRYKKDEYIVPGVPEADTQQEKIGAIQKWWAWVNQRPGMKANYLKMPDLAGGQQ